MIKREIPILYIYFLIRIRDRTKTEIITKKLFKGIIARVLCKGGGVPKFMIKHIIDDMVKLGLAQKITNSSYKIPKHNREKRMRLLIDHCI